MPCIVSCMQCKRSTINLFSTLYVFYHRYRQSHDKTDFQSSYDRIQKLDQYHGLPSGIFACDEHLAGNMPSRGEKWAV